MNKFADRIKVIPNGSVTSPAGFRACGVTAGFKRSGAPDMALLVSDHPAHFAAAFTSCTFAAAPVLIDRERARTESRLRAVIINSGNANACTGEPGLRNAETTCSMVAEKLGVPPRQVMASSTGRIGTQMPMETVARGIELAVPALNADGGLAAAEAIMTTDTTRKSVARALSIAGRTVTIGAMTKGSGMIDPKMRTVPHATMLCYITTDAAADNALLNDLLARGIEQSFNRITVDGDMSTNDTTLLLANGASGVTIAAGTPEAELFYAALEEIMQDLARQMVMDGEGATKFVTVLVQNAPDEAAAKLCAEAIANSLLCKTAWFGCDPNWGRIVAALGYSTVPFDPDKVDVFYDSFPVVKQGGDAGTAEKVLAEVLKKREFTVTVDLNAGTEAYWVWTCDISYEYVKINAEYHT
ncbi:bifunctional glutamate N-acetyltransferase/amino-acid acetyltransferase ArgJ [Victivallis sp. Marseille-Q1083]|uniref:bifunctional glutamate N-acetyltransferase/amino-acid acetyltransferase ArgJ n=1 Tax=Victivallis sp. Marseille-Q1083 TaxID=2717288 RepID=UPI00158C5B86|nr:bifunctional glutamate N-acetyltransferase/amino-acid acetyltransferase ArgJ [Victivallis sp. Marseille-Q1083]